MTRPTDRTSNPGDRTSNPGGDSLKTLPLEDGARLRDELRTALKASQRPVLVVISGNEMGTRKRVESNLLVGRDPSADLVLTDAGVSWQHARLEDRGDSWALIDLGSTNGSTVNGQRVSERELTSNDKIVLGRTILRFEVQDAMEQAYDEQLQRMLNIDDLSGLYVRRRFDAELGNLLSAARSQGGSVALLVMDLDGVKGINDTHGHLFGAYTIGEAGHVIGRVIEGRGIASRFGGDEFCAAMSHATVTEGAALGEEIRAAIAEHKFEHAGIPLRPGISIGVAAFPESAEDQPSLFQRADEALYRAKQNGKNRVCV
jgi:two-component system cell cycle response regulator